MAQFRQYLTVTHPAGEDNETIILQLQTFNATTNITISTETDPFAENEDIITSAITIETGLNALLVAEEAEYSGTPDYSGTTPSATFQVTRTDNVICVFSQAMFRLSLLDNTADLGISIGESPIFTSIDEAQTLVTVLGGEFVDINGTCLSEDQILLLMSISSEALVNWFNNPIVLSTYIHEETGKRATSVLLEMLPVVQFDLPSIRRTQIGSGLSTIYIPGQGSYGLDSNRGILSFLFSTNVMDVFEPFDYGNDIKISYKAGNMNIPTGIKTAAVLAGLENLRDQTIQSLAGGSFKVTFFTQNAKYTSLLNTLYAYDLS